MRSGAVAGFLPSQHGFRFANRWPPGPTVRLGPLDFRHLGLGDATSGLCGGMVASARDLFEAGIAPPREPAPPPNGSPRFRYIVRRHVQSLDWLGVPLRCYDLQAFRPDPPSGLAQLLGRRPAREVALDEEWPQIRDAIDLGVLPIVGLVRAAGWSPGCLARHHQVLAHAYEEYGDALLIRIYDPNHPARDDVALRVRVGPDRGGPRWERIELSQTTGEPLLGFFRQPDPPPPGTLRAWR